MAVTAIPVNTIGRAGVEPPTEASPNTADGNSFPNNGLTWLEVTNSNGSSANVTVDYASKVDGQTVPAKTYAVAASKKRRIGPFPTNLFGRNVVVHCPSGVTLSAWQLDR